MQMPHPTLAAETLLKTFGVYHLTRLQAEPAAKAIAEAFAKAQDRLETKLSAWDKARIAAQAAMAVRDGEDDALDTLLRRFANVLLSKTNNNRKAPLYQRYLSDGLGPVVTAPLEAEVSRVRAIVDRLGEEKDAEVSAFAPLFAVAAEKLEKAMDAHTASLAAEVSTYEMVEAEKIAWLDLYKYDHRQLSLYFHADPKRAESFFKPAAREKRAAAPSSPAK